MTIEQGLEHLAQQTCPQDVDVVDSVMAKISQQPLPQSTHRRQLWQRISYAAAAAVALILIANVALLQNRNSNEEHLGSMIAQVYDYDSYASWSAIEEAAYDDADYYYNY